MNYYRQCRLQKGTIHLTSWIPEEFAKKGRIVGLRSWGNKDWNEGWTVMEVYDRLREDKVIERSQDYKHQRKMSDV